MIRNVTSYAAKWVQFSDEIKEHTKLEKYKLIKKFSDKIL